MAAPNPQRRFKNPTIFICDIQEAFRPSIHLFPAILSTTSKLLHFAQRLSLPVIVTTQNKARLGDTVSELLSLLSSSQVVANVDKTRFSMFIPPIPSLLPPKSEIAIVGIESHICVTQTALDVLAAGHVVYIIADGVSSSNAEEVPIALARLRQAGAIVTTSESWMYECMGDAGIEEFRSVVKLVKETGKETKASLQGLLGSKI